MILAGGGGVGGAGRGGVLALTGDVPVEGAVEFLCMRLLAAA